MRQEKVYIIVLAYKGWQDSILCLESLIRMRYQSWQLIFVDNYSPDDSWEQLLRWADGQLLYVDSESKLSYLYQPPVVKPVKHRVLTSFDVEQGVSITGREILTLVRAETNRGYSAGNNIGIRLAMQQSDAHYIWILNNDTLVPADTLSVLVNAFSHAPEKTAIMGAKVVYADQPDRIQCLGGSVYNPWLGRAHQVYTGYNVASLSNMNNVPPIDYVAGASMLVRSNFIYEIGLLSETYFLYFEELDWCTRAKRAGWHITYEPQAVVYHKEGASIGASKASTHYSNIMADYYFHRSRFLYTQTYCNLMQRCSIYGVTLYSLIKSALVGQFAYTNMFWRLLTNRRIL